MRADNERQLVDAVKAAATQGQALQIAGGGSKDFYGRDSTGDPLPINGYVGVVSYEPTELVLTARAGTPLTDVLQLLEENGQMLPFEPPQFADSTTLGGAVASGLAGPRRPWGGAPRDLVLGTKLLDGTGQVLRFGGQVMKNVAGYDISRLMAGALGTLGVLLEISLKVLPKPAVERTQRLAMSREDALAQMRTLAALPAPLSGAAHDEGYLYMRLSGNAASVNSWAKKIGGDETDNRFWADLRDHKLAFFKALQPLWRLVVAPASRKLPCEEQSLLDWAGGQRWVYTESSSAVVRSQAAELGGHATLFRNKPPNADVFHPLAPGIAELHRELKGKFDPLGILNKGRMYADW